MRAACAVARRTGHMWQRQAEAAVASVSGVGQARSCQRRHATMRRLLARHIVEHIVEHIAAYSEAYSDYMLRYMLSQ